jgi:MFS family permease
VRSEKGRTAATHKLPRAVWLFGFTSLVNDFASEMIYPLLPAFVTGALGGGALALGILDGVADAVAALFKLVSGYLAERPRLRGPLVVAGYAIAAVIRPLIAVAAAAWHVIALRGADRVGKGIRAAPRDTMISDLVPAEVRGRAFGLQRAADHVGAILGPLTAALLIYVGLGMRSVFGIAALPGLAAVVFAWIAVREAGPRDRVSGARESSVPDTSHLTPDTRSGFASLTAVLVLATFLRAPETLLILRAQDLGVPVALVPILWAALHVVRSSTSYPGGVLADRWGPRRTLALGWLIYAGLALAFAAATTTALAWVIFLAFGVFVGFTESPERKLVAELAPGGRRGRGFGWYYGSLSAVALPGAALFGWIYQNRGAAPALEASAVVTLLAVLALPLSSIASGRRSRSGG